MAVSSNYVPMTRCDRKRSKIPRTILTYIKSVCIVIAMNAKPPQTWKCEHTLKGHTASVNAVAIDPQGNILACGSDDRTVSLWDLKTGKPIFTFFGLLNAVFSVAFSPGTPLLISGDFDKTITCWNLDTKAVRSFSGQSGTNNAHSGYIFSVAFTPDGETIASGSADKTIKIWNIPRWVSTRTLRGHTDTVWSIAISPDGQIIASASADKTIGIWPLNSWDEPRILTGHSGWVTSVAIGDNGKIMASGSQDSTIKLWNLNTLKLLCTLSGHSAAVWSVAFSRDKQILASAGKDGVKLWNLSTGELLHTLSGRHPIAFSPDGKTLVTGGDGTNIKIWRQYVPVTESAPNPMLSGEWYSILGVDKLASPQEVKLAYRRLIKQYHPDLNRSANAKDIMQAINEAYAKFEEEARG